MKASTLDLLRLMGTATQWRQLFSVFKVGTEQRRILYHQYIQSRAWAGKRAAAMARAGGCCERCGNTEATEVHHRTYARLGDETDADLAAMCRRCHTRQHGAAAENTRDIGRDAAEALEWVGLKGPRENELKAESGHTPRRATA